jgi:quinol monooxygenase YgiN
MNNRKNQPVTRQKTRLHVFSNAFRQFLVMAGTALLFIGSSVVHAQDQGMMVRMSEIDVHPKHLEQYKTILKDEAEASVRLEPGVIAIFPMYQRENASTFRIIEIYASREAYEGHLKTPHFLHYKSGTSAMVKSLRLVDMEALDAATMAQMFTKLRK